MAGAPIRVLCVDDQNLVRECVVAVIERDPGLRVAAEARSVKRAVERFTETRPDVTVISLHPRGLDCLQTIRSIRRLDPRARIVVYARRETEAVYLALEAGAAGFVLKDACSGELVRAIADVHGRTGGQLDGIREKLEARGGRTLTSREVEILELFSHGLRTKAVAETLHISDHTVKLHMKRVYEKLGVHGRAAALTEGLRRGFVRLAASRQVPTAAPTRRSDADVREGAA
jgi:DNA-binding NarL/FixJ family response regulator